MQGLQFSKSLLGRSPDGLGQGKTSLDDMILDTNKISTFSPQAASGYRVYISRPWPNGIIPIEFSAGISQAKRDYFMQSCADWGAEGHVRCIARTNEPAYAYVSADDPNGCFANVGYDGGRRILNLGTPCWTPYTVLHELGHMIGLMHEHQRPDRDQYITINTSVVDPQNRFAFDLLGDADVQSDYDFLSIMHYQSDAGSVNGQPSILAKAPYASFQNLMGRRQFLSANDRAVVARTYNPPLNPVRGYLDGIQVNADQSLNVQGWACQSFSNTPVDVHLYVDGAAGTGTIVAAATANSASEPAVAAACSASGSNYRFNIVLSAAQALNLSGRALFVHAISQNGSENSVIAGSNRNAPIFDMARIQAEQRAAAEAEARRLAEQAAAEQAAIKAQTNQQMESLVLVPIYRLHNPAAIDWLISTSPTEGVGGGYTPEHHAFSLSRDGGVGRAAIYRCYRSNGRHFLSGDAGCEGNTPEHVIGYMQTSPGAGLRPLYRFYRSDIDAHLHSTSREEGLNNGFTLEGVMGYVW